MFEALVVQKFAGTKFLFLLEETQVCICLQFKQQDRYDIK